MKQSIHQLGDSKVLMLDASGGEFDTDGLANDLIGLAWGHEASVIAVPAEAMPGRFYELRSGLLGEVTQKFANYRLQLVILGDVSQHVAASTAFRDYVHEANGGRTLWFEADLDALAVRLTAL